MGAGVGGGSPQPGPQMPGRSSCGSGNEEGAGCLRGPACPPAHLRGPACWPAYPTPGAGHSTALARAPHQPSQPQAAPGRGSGSSSSSSSSSSHSPCPWRSTAARRPQPRPSFLAGGCGGRGRCHRPCLLCCWLPSRDRCSSRGGPPCSPAVHPHWQSGAPPPTPAVRQGRRGRAGAEWVAGLAAGMQAIQLGQ